jgi:hypothetical protein
MGPNELQIFNKNPNDAIGNRTRDLSFYSAVPQLTWPPLPHSPLAPPHANLYLGARVRISGNILAFRIRVLRKYGVILLSSAHRSKLLCTFLLDSNKLSPTPTFPYFIYFLLPASILRLSSSFV